jgi:hypothetical protein
MRTHPFFAFVCAIVSTVVAVASRDIIAQVGGASPDLKCGEATNGIRGEIEVVTRSNSGPAAEVAVYVARVAPPSGEETNLLIGVTSENIVNRLVNNQWPYFMATNSFCGPIELRGAGGRALHPLKPGVSSPSAYTSAYNVEVAHSNYFRQFLVSLRPKIFPTPLLGTRQRSEMVRFNLTEYFDLKEPGEYQLIVWPKVYKRLSATNDLCQRIDVPPVSVTVKWP